MLTTETMNEVARAVGFRARVREISPACVLVRVPECYRNEYAARDARIVLRQAGHPHRVIVVETDGVGVEIRRHADFD